MPGATIPKHGADVQGLGAGFNNSDLTIKYWNNFTLGTPTFTYKFYILFKHYKKSIL